MSITTTGYSLKRFEDIIAELRQDLITASGDPNLDLSDDSLIGIINNIYGLKFSELHELAQALWSSGDVDTASGIALDRLVARGRVYRQAASKSYGELQFTSTFGAVIPAGTQVRDLESITVETNSATTLDNMGVYSVVLNPTAVNNFNYTVTINGATYSHLSDGAATAAEVVNGLVIALQTNPVVTASNVSNTLVLAAVDSSFSYLTSANFSVVSVTKSILSTAVNEGYNELEAGTLNRLVTPNPAITVNNKDQWISGRDLETDSELRNRFLLSVGGQGNATVEAIRAKVAAIPNVIKVFVEENTTLVTSASGLPAKSFEVTVKGGADLEVATNIWRSKPAGIQAFGNTSTPITDSEGNTQTIFYTRPIDQYIHTRVTYQLYSEELFPVDGAVQIAQAVLSFGEALNIAEDVIAQRIIGAVYAKVAGISNLTVQIGKTNTPSGTPVYTTGIVPIGKKEESVFDLSRITVIAG
jgi:uncharacterized phage protein gp47/JayE